MSEQCCVISVVVPTCNRLDLLLGCLGKMKVAVEALENIECQVVVTDDRWATETEIVLKREFPWVKYVQGPSRGPAANRNCGVRAAGGEWLVFVDDDCRPGPGFLVAYWSAIESRVMVYEGAVTCVEGIKSPLECAPVNLKGGYLWSCNMMVSRKVFESMGGFDEGFMMPHLEDVDFHERLRKGGHATKFVPNAVVDHPARRCVSGKRLGAMTESEVYFAIKWGLEKGMIRRIILAKLMGWLRTILRYRIGKDSVLAVIRMVQEFCYFIPRIRGWRKKYQKREGRCV